MTQKEAYAIGFDFGTGLADCNDCQHCAWGADDSARQYSPFEFTCKEFNDLPEDGRNENGTFTISPDEAWAAFDEGNAAAIGTNLVECCGREDCESC